MRRSKKTSTKSQRWRTRPHISWCTFVAVSILWVAGFQLSLNLTIYKDESPSQSVVLHSLTKNHPSRYSQSFPPGRRDLRVVETNSTSSPNKERSSIVRKKDQQPAHDDNNNSSRGMMIDVASDPLRASNFAGTAKGILVGGIEPGVQYLGVLLDAGRHYFPVVWIKRLLDRLHDLHYNLLHFRLTDDQAFNVRFNSHPELAYPTIFQNPDRLVYSVEELRDLTAYARARGIQIMPEINLPGHAGAWAGARDDLVVHCPTFICEKGYGLALNVTHHDLPVILKDIITETIEIFDPPFLHLGGDEVELASPCFNQLGIEMFDYTAFENMLEEIVVSIGYPLENVVRWEITGQAKLERRAGKIEHFWEPHHIGTYRNAKGPFLLSTGLYFDTNETQDAFDVYEKTRLMLEEQGRGQQQLPMAIIAGTFELSTETWYDRNVLGKLLAVAMGTSIKSTNTWYHNVLMTLLAAATGTSFRTAENFYRNELGVLLAGVMGSPEEIEDSLEMNNRRKLFLEDWKTHCDDWLGFGSKICATEGRGLISFEEYQKKWIAQWSMFKKDLCTRLASPIPGRSFPRQEESETRRTRYASVIEFVLQNSPLQARRKIPVSEPLNVLPKGWESVLKRNVAGGPQVGVILDVSSSMVDTGRLLDIMSMYIARLGFTLIQLPLVTDKGFVYKSRIQPQLVQSLLSSQAHPAYDIVEHLGPLITKAAGYGIDVMPEVSVSTGSAGWSKSELTLNCAQHFCGGGDVVTDISRPQLIPVLYAVIGELYQTFSSPYIHLGSDERHGAKPCLREAGVAMSEFDSFEKELNKLLEKSGIGVDNVLRWDNKEQTHYPGRAGKITHYRAGADPEELKARSAMSSPFFATVDILEGDALSVYERTRELVALEPTGVLAEIRSLTKQSWAQLEIPQRLVAFALGAAASTKNSSKTLFQSHYTELCQSLGWNLSGKGGSEGCTPPRALGRKFIPETDTPEFTRRHCTFLTVPAQVYKAKKPPLRVG